MLLNVGEGDIPKAGEMADGMRSRVTHAQTMVESLSARIEMELGELPEEEAEVFRQDLGLTGSSSLERVIRLSYQLLGLISFFTAGPDETRAWTIPDGSSAVDAAGAIHSDLARGFIRAEVVDWEDLLALGSAPRHARRQAALRGQDLPHPRRGRHRGPVQRLSPRGRPEREGADAGRPAPSCRDRSVGTPARSSLSTSMRRLR